MQRMVMELRTRSDTTRALAIYVTILSLVSGCARYVAKPLLPEHAVSRFQTRSLGDEGLRRHLEGTLGPRLPVWPLQAWPLEPLTHAAFYFHPGLDAARARWGVAQAQVLTAGARPAPGIGVTPAYTTDTDAGRAPWYMQFGFDLTLETAGKREHRTAEAIQRAEAARFGVALTAWTIYAGVRDGLVGFQVATGEAAFLREEEAIRTEYVSLLETQVSVGELARPVLDAARLELQRTQLGLARAGAAIDDARRDVARAMGTPYSALNGQTLVAGLSEPPRIDLPVASGIVATALVDRIDLRQMLAEYAAAEASLRLMVARQVPDIGLGPVVRWAVDQQRWSLATALGPLSRQRGPIAEATARREETAARFYARQTEVVADADAALDRYQAVTAEYARAAELLSRVEARAAETQTLFDLRDIDAVALVGSHLEVLFARRARFDTLSRVHRALGVLEDTVHRPLTFPGGLPPGLEAPPSRQP